MYSLETLEHINFELTSFCNARCPQCQRFNIFGDVHRDLYQTHLDLNLINKLPIKKLSRLKYVTFIGNFGDPLMHPNIDEILHKFKNKEISISTNASLRNEEWWMKLPLKIKNLWVTFCIDGLADTHHLYRRNTSFKKILDNAKSFIDNGGKAKWQFIVFKHNEHQIKDAEELAKQMGFKKFFPMYSDRFDSTDKWKVYQKDKHIYNLEKATSQTTLREKVKSKHGEKFWKKMFEGAEKKNIECPWAQQKKIYIHSDGTVFPCCHIGSVKAGKKIENRMYEKIVRNWQDVNLHTKSFEEIINGPQYKEYFERSLKDRPHPTCIENCNNKTGRLLFNNLNTVNT